MFTLLCLALALSFLTMLAVVIAALLTVRESLKQMQSQMRNLISLNKDLTNLAASKDLETFRHLTAITTTNPMETSAFSEANIVPMDDQAMVARLAEAYKAHGIDPQQAYDNPLDDFGPGAFM